MPNRYKLIAIHRMQPCWNDKGWNVIWHEMSQDEMEFGMKCCIKKCHLGWNNKGWNVIWDEMSQDEMSFGMKCYIKKCHFGWNNKGWNVIWDEMSSYLTNMPIIRAFSGSRYSVPFWNFPNSVSLLELWYFSILTILLLPDIPLTTPPDKITAPKISVIEPKITATPKLTVPAPTGVPQEFAESLAPENVNKVPKWKMKTNSWVKVK